MKRPEMPIHSFTGRSTSTHIYILYTIYVIYLLYDYYYVHIYVGKRILSFLPCSPAFFQVPIYSTCALSYLSATRVFPLWCSFFFLRNMYTYALYIIKAPSISRWSIIRILRIFAKETVTVLLMYFFFL